MLASTCNESALKSNEIEEQNLSCTSYLLSKKNLQTSQINDLRSATAFLQVSKSMKIYLQITFILHQTVPKDVLLTPISTICEYLSSERRHSFQMEHLQTKKVTPHPEDACSNRILKMASISSM